MKIEMNNQRSKKKLQFEGRPQMYDDIMDTIKQLQTNSTNNRESIVRLEGRLEGISNDSTEIKDVVKALSSKFDRLIPELDRKYSTKEEVRPVIDFYNSLKDKAIWAVIGAGVLVAVYVILKEANFFIGLI